jgi:two-component sensor histidine kinase
MAPVNPHYLSDGPLYNEKNSQGFGLLLQDLHDMSRASDINSLLEQSLHLTQKLMHVEASALMIRNNGSLEFLTHLPSGLRRSKVTDEQAKKGFPGWIMTNGKPRYENKISREHLLVGKFSDDYEVMNISGVPVSDDSGEVFGVLQAINRSGGMRFADHDIPVLEMLSNCLGQSIERVRESAELKRQVFEKEMMLTEVHHRLKNNLSTINGLIEMELPEIDDEVAVRLLKKTSSRINAMASVHDLLYGAELQNRINLKYYFEDIISKMTEILARPTQHIEIELHADDIQLETERAMSCGLLINELIVNCYKHAFDDANQDGRVKVALSRNPGGYLTLCVSDNGSGIGENFKRSDSGTVGSWLIDVLVKRLEATLEIANSDGTTFTIRFKE